MSINRNISVIAVDSFSSLLQLFRASQTGQPIYQEKFFEREISNLTSRFPNVLLLYSKQVNFDWFPFFQTQIPTFID